MSITSTFIWIYLAVYLIMCICLFVHVCMGRASQNVPEKSSVAGNVSLEGQQLMLQDDSAYSTIDDTEGQKFTGSINPPYSDAAAQSSQSPTQDDHTYANVGSLHWVVNVKSGKPALSTSLKPVHGAKWQSCILQGLHGGQLPHQMAMYIKNKSHPLLFSCTDSRCLTWSISNIDYEYYQWFSNIVMILLVTHRCFWLYRYCILYNACSMNNQFCCFSSCDSSSW